MVSRGKQDKDERKEMFHGFQLRVSVVIRDKMGIIMKMKCSNVGKYIMYVEITKATYTIIFYL